MIVPERDAVIEAEVLPAGNLPAPLAPPVVAEVVDEPGGPPSCLIVRGWRAACSAGEWVFGLATVVVGLAVLATVPVAQFLSLGYLLEASGRVARTGRLAAGFPGVRQAARVGSIAAGTWLMLLPLWYVSSVAASARLIAPRSPAARGWTMALWVLTVMVVGHIVGAVWRGGRLRHFFWPAPLKVLRLWFRRGAYAQARDAVCEFVARMRLPYLAWLGFRGFVGGLLWLVVPVSLLVAGQRFPALDFLGGGLLIVALLYLPFVQTRFAAENRFGALWEVGGARQWFRRAPLAFVLALLVTLLFALPLYLLKIALIPREAAWLPSLVFVAFIYPARLLMGWACGRGRRRHEPRNFVVRQVARLAMVPIVGAYVFLVFFTQYTSWYGVWSLYEQHAFLLPAPFLGF